MDQSAEVVTTYVPPPTLPEPSKAPVSVEFMHADLARSGLLPQDINAYPVQPIAMGGVGAYCIPYHHNPLMYRNRYDRAENKYIGPPGMTDVWIPPQLSVKDLQDAQTIWIIEGEKKAAKFFQYFSVPTIGIGGCFNFAESHPESRPVLLPILLAVLQQGKKVNVVFDADVKTKVHVQTAAKRMHAMLEQLRVELRILTVPSRVTTQAHPGIPQITQVKGVDDWLVTDKSVRLDDFELVDPTSFQDSLNEMFLRLGCMPDKNKRPLAVEANAVKLIPELTKGTLTASIYTGLKYDDGFIQHDQPDGIMVHLLTLLQIHCNHQFKMVHVKHALASLESKVLVTNPVAEWFTTLQWDGVPRLNTWASGVLQAADMQEDYVNEWGRLLISGITMRVLEPGCQLDYVFILAGPQGIGKTTFFRELANIAGEDYYVEYAPSKNLGGDGELRSQGAVFKRNIIVDFSEGVLLKKYSSEEVKSLITRREDSFRKLYSTSMDKNPRHAICVGTTNQLDMLHDPSGSRRFIILSIDTIGRLPQVERDQLFAEAYVRRQEFKARDWHEIKAAMPAYEKGEVHVTNAQQAYNSKFAKVDDALDQLRIYLQSEHQHAFATHTPRNGEPYAGPVYIRQQLDDAVMSRLPGVRVTGNVAAKAAQTPSFPFAAEQLRININNFRFPNEALKGLFQDCMNQGDKTVRVWVFHDKAL